MKSATVLAQDWHKATACALTVAKNVASVPSLGWLSHKAELLAKVHREMEAGLTDMQTKMLSGAVADMAKQASDKMAFILELKEFVSSSERVDAVSTMASHITAHHDMDTDIH